LKFAQLKTFKQRLMVVESSEKSAAWKSAFVATSWIDANDCTTQNTYCGKVFTACFMINARHFLFIDWIPLNGIDYLLPNEFRGGINSVYEVIFKTLKTVPILSPVCYPKLIC
jgi:hypothetical protein